MKIMPSPNNGLMSAKGKKRKLDEEIHQDADDEVTVQQTTSTESEMDVLFANLCIGGSKPLTLALIPEYSDEYVPKSSLHYFPVPLKSLQQASHFSLGYLSLLQVCQSIASIEIELTSEIAQ